MYVGINTYINIGIYYIKININYSIITMFKEKSSKKNIFPTIMMFLR